MKTTYNACFYTWWHLSVIVRFTHPQKVKVKKRTVQVFQSDSVPILHSTLSSRRLKSIFRVEGMSRVGHYSPRAAWEQTARKGSAGAGCHFSLWPSQLLHCSWWSLDFSCTKALPTHRAHVPKWIEQKHKLKKTSENAAHFKLKDRKRVWEMLL